MPVDRLFLYGTLLPELVRPPFDTLVSKMTRLGPATVPGRLYDLGPYPGLVLDDAASTVRGELFALPEDPAVLAVLDDYEGSCLYPRVECRATTASGETVSCWVYECHADLSRAVVILHGDYREWCRIRPAGPLGNIAERLASFAEQHGLAADLPADLAANHDSHGLPQGIDRQ